MDVALFAVLAPPAIVMVVVTGARLWPVRSRPAAQVVLVYLTFSAGLLLSNVLELISDTEAWTFRFAQLNYVFLFGVVVSWVTFAMVYSGSVVPAHPRVTVPLSGVFLIFLGVIGTADRHDWFWREVTYLNHGPFTTLHASYGPWFWAMGVFLYAVLSVGAVTLVRAAVGLPRWYRRQSRLLVAAAVVPLVFNLLYVFRALPWLDKDFTPLMYALSGIGFFLAMNRHGLVRQRPIPRSLLLEDIQSGVIVVDRDGWISDMNPEARRILSEPDQGEAEVGTQIRDTGALRFVLADHPLDRFERFTTTRERSDGETETFDVTIRPAQDARGRAVATILTLHDTTAWQRMQEERQDMQLRMVAQERLATVGQLAAGVAHEVNNPLTSLRSVYRAVADMAANAADTANAGADAAKTAAEQGAQKTIAGFDDKLADLNSTFQRGLDRINAVLRGLMESAQPEDSRSFIRVDLHELIESTLQLARTRYRDVAVIERAYQALPLVEVDPGSINQVLLNIIVNAAQALDEHKAQSDAPSSEPGTIRVETYDRGAEVECRILNSGPSIPPELSTRIFEPFFTTKPRGTGTGLGLAISRRIVETLHGGTLRLMPGGTAGFIIRLPVEQRTGDDAP